MSIKSKILLLVILPVFVASGLVGFMSIHFYNKILTEQLLREGITTLYTLRVAMKEPAVTRDLAKVREVVKAYGRMKDVLLVAVEGPGGTWASAPEQRIPDELAGVMRSRMGYSTEVVRYWKVDLPQGISRGGTTYSSVYLFQVSLVEGLKVNAFLVMPTALDLVVNANKLLATTTGIIAAALALLVAMLAALVARGIAHNIMYLAEVARRISLGDLEVEVRKLGDDEFGSLAEDIEKMRQSLKAAIERLRKRRAV